MFICVEDENMPTLVFESGFSESHPRLDDDVPLWITGGAPTVQLVFLLKWNKMASLARIEGVINIYGKDENGYPVLLLSQVINSIHLSYNCGLVFLKAACCALHTDYGTFSIH